LQSIKVLYEESGEDRIMNPIWMIYESTNFKWDEIIYIAIKAPFQCLSFHDFYSEVPAVSVPEAAYVRKADNEHMIGIHMPTVYKSAYQAVFFRPNINDFDLSSVSRLVLQVNDVENVLQYSIKENLSD